MRLLSRNIFFKIATMLASAIFLFAGCSDDSELRAKEEETILKYITANYKEEDYTVTDGVYRVITGNFFDAIEDNTYDPPVINDGDRADIIFEIYSFTGSKPAQSNTIYSNNETLIKELVKEGINPEYWPLEPMPVTVGNGEIIQGIDISLPGCRLGDTAIIIIPSRMAYGKAEIGIVGSDKMLYCVVLVTRVNDEPLLEDDEL